MFIDIHTHANQAMEADILAIKSLYGDFERVDESGLFSIGLHPWFLSEFETNLTKIAGLCARTNVLAVGEAGLDRLCTTDWATQLYVFSKQIELANQANKPLIIHCVRAVEQIETMLKKVSVPVVFHGANFKPSVAKSLLDKSYYFSFGTQLLKESHAKQMLPNLPPERYFLETDDSSISIKEMYQRAAEIRQCTTEDIILQIEQNFKTVLNK